MACVCGIPVSSDKINRILIYLGLSLKSLFLCCVNISGQRSKTLLWKMWSVQ